VYILEINVKLLEVENINTFYGLSHILFNVSLEVEKGETVCLLGRNGAGKSTTLKSIMGLVKTRSGNVKFKGQKISDKSAHIIAKTGIGFVPEDRRIFPNLTVKANLEIARKASPKGSYDWDINRIYSIFPILEERDLQSGGMLSGGEQQMLTIARSLMGNPELLLIDEPSEGLSPIVVEIVKKQIIQLQNEGMAMLIVEQNSEFVLSVSNRAYVLEKGIIKYTGNAKELKADQTAKKQYLGI
jgi:branched-chain amino acid transport system ATP-binding protein